MTFRFHSAACHLLGYALDIPSRWSLVELWESGHQTNHYNTEVWWLFDSSVLSVIFAVMHLTFHRDGLWSSCGNLMTRRIITIHQCGCIRAIEVGTVCILFCNSAIYFFYLMPVLLSSCQASDGAFPDSKESVSVPLRNDSIHWRLLPIQADSISPIPVMKQYLIPGTNLTYF